MSDLGTAGTPAAANVSSPIVGRNPGAPTRPVAPDHNSHATATAVSSTLIGKGIGNNNTNKAK